MKNIFSKRSSGFTFIEILLVISLLSIISLSLYNVFANGIKIWKRIYGPLEEEDIAISLDKIRVDLTNAVVYSKIPFEGEKESLSFATIVRTKADAKKTKGEHRLANEIGGVRYIFDKKENNLYRMQANYSQALKEKYPDVSLLAKDIKSVVFYYIYKSGVEYVMEEEAKNILPSILRVDIEFLDGKENRRLTKLINVPIGD